MTEHFDASWLTLREPFDQAARSTILARRFADRLPMRPQIVDLGAGTGSMFRFLAPIIGRRQDWLLIDADTALLDDACGRTAAWARRRGYTATSSGAELAISTPQGLWRMEIMKANIAQPPLPLPLRDGVGGRGPNALVCSALLDLVSASWLNHLLDYLSIPFLASLTVDGRASWHPHHPSDTRVRTAFRRDQFRDKGFGPALGPTAPAVALRTLASRGFLTASAPSDWRIPRTALGIQRALIEGRGFSDPHWQAARLRQAMRGRLAITIGHRDILAFPPGG